MPTAWPLSIARGPLQKADLLLDTTCFSTLESSNLSDFESDNDFDSNLNRSSHSYLGFMAGKSPLDADVDTEARKGYISNSTLNAEARYNHPTFPSVLFLTSFLQPTRFATYIANEFPSVTLDNSTVSLTTNPEPLRKEVNATFANTMLNTNIPTTIATLDWISDKVFPNSSLPVAFDDKCLDNVEECWDMVSQKFSHFPDATLEHTVQDWLNHLAHTLGVRHGLIQPAQSSDAELSDIYDEAQAAELVGGQGGDEAGDNTTSGIDNPEENSTADPGADLEEPAFVVSSAEDRSFSMVTHKKGPSGGFRLRKPDIILVNRNLRHFLHKHKFRPRWHHIDAIIEVSSSAPRVDMLQQILEKAALMFESQPYRRFVLGLAIRGTAATSLEYSFLLIDRSGVCITIWRPCAGYDGINFARIIYGACYGKAELLGIDTTMTVDLLSGNVTHILVNGQKFTVVKHIHASLVLFGRGTHVFLVRDEHGQHHILKDAWLLKVHGLSEVTVLSQIHNVLKDDDSDQAKRYRSLHSRYITGEELDDSTSDRRGRLTDKPADRVHRRVVTGPVGDPLTTFRSRKEFIQVLLDCVEWLEFLHKKCKLVHGDLSVNNIVIFRQPSARPPTKTVSSKKTTVTPNPTPRVTRNTSRQGGAPIIPAPIGGVDDIIPIVGTIIDYDYARALGTVMEKTSGTLPFMPLDALNIDNRGKYIHGPAHDLEALLQTALGIVTFTNGPYQPRTKSNPHIPMARWYNEGDREQLFKDKSYDVFRFDRDVAAYIPQYWQPLVPYFRRLVSATWTDIDCTSKATHEAYKSVLTEALQALAQYPEVPAKYACSPPKKRPRSSGNNDESRWPYKFLRGNGPGSERLPRPAFIKELSEWQDSVDA